MNITDANCFIGHPPFKLITCFPSPEDLLREMDDLGIERAFVSDFQALHGQFPHESNRRLSEKLAKHSARLQPCWIIHPDKFALYLDEERLLNEITAERIQMVRIMPGRGFELTPWAFKKLAEGLASSGTVIRIDIANADGLSHEPVSSVQLNDVVAFAKAFPQTSIILFSQKLGARCFEIPRLLTECPNVHLDISSFQHWRGIELLCRHTGAQKLVFGSYMPYFDAGQFMVELACANISEDEKEMIAWRNIEEILRK